MALLSDDTLTFLVNRAKSIHHGEIRLMINADSPNQVTVEVLEKERFTTDDKVLPVGKPPRRIPAGDDPIEGRRRG